MLAETWSPFWNRTKTWSAGLTSLACTFWSAELVTTCALVRISPSFETTKPLPPASPSGNTEVIVTTPRMRAR